jgi:hypothetical protein
MPGAFDDFRNGTCFAMFSLKGTAGTAMLLDLMGGVVRDANRIAVSCVVLACVLLSGCRRAGAELAVRPDHPRIWITPGKLAVLRNRARAGTPEWERLIHHLDTPDTWYRESTLAMSASLASLCLRDGDPAESRRYADLAVEKAFAVIARGVPDDLGTYKVSVGEIAVIYDWLCDALTPQQKREIIEYVNDAYEKTATVYPQAWVNYNFDIMFISGISGYATFGDNAKAREMIDHAREYRWGFTRPALDFTGVGGGWVEENGYAMETTYRLACWLAAVRTATGEDLFRSIDFMRDRLLYELLSMYPNASDDYGRPYYEHVPTGDGRQGIGPWQYARIGRLITIEALPETDYARYAQAWVSRPPANKMGYEWLSMWDFLFYNPDQDSLPLDATPLACYARGTGTVVMKGDWTQDGTLIHFQGGGPHLEYHQHLDKNSFVIYKKQPLAIDSGTYDGMGDQADHVLNYYKRTIAHNSILVYRPDETWTWMNTWQYKPGENDGGQRAMSVYTFSGTRVGPWVPFNSTGMKNGEWPYDTYRVNFDCGSTPRFEHTDGYTYVMGDAAKAYPAWRVQNFKRHLVYLRPPSPGEDEFIVILDRVSCADPAWKKYWLLHFLTEPAVANGTETVIAPGISEYAGANLVIVENGGGKLFSKTLLPRHATIRKIGGPPEYDSWVFGTNHEFADECCYGWGRIEVVPDEPRRDDVFLHVLYPTLAATRSMPPVVPVDEENLAGVSVDGRICVFSKTEEPLDEGEFEAAGNGNIRFLLVDLEPEQTFDVTRDGTGVYTGTSSANSVLSFDLMIDGAHRVGFRKIAGRAGAGKKQP